jgi:hypothetical protein
MVRFCSSLNSRPTSPLVLWNKKMLYGVMKVLRAGSFPVSLQSSCIKTPLRIYNVELHIYSRTFSLWLDNPSVPGLPVLDSSITLRQTTAGRTPLDEWSCRRRKLYLTPHHTTLATDRHPWPRRDSNTQCQQASGRKPTPYTAGALESSCSCTTNICQCQWLPLHPWTDI